MGQRANEAVADDLLRRGVTTRALLGIQGNEWVVRDQGRIIYGSCSVAL